MAQTEPDARAALAGRRRRLAFWLQSILTVAVVAVIAWLVYDNWDSFVRILDVGPAELIGISAAVLASFVVLGVMIQALANHFGARIPLTQTVLLGLMTTTLNYLPMKTGTFVEGVILRTRYQVKFSHFLALVAGSNAMHVWATFSVAGLFLLVEGVDEQVLAWSLLILPTAGLAGLMWWGLRHEAGADPTHESRIVRGVVRAVRGLREIFGEPRMVVLLVVTNLVLVLLNAVRFWLAFRAVSSPVSFTEALVIASVAVVTHRLSVLPGGIGFREGGVAVAAALVGVPAGVGLAAALVDRAIMLVWIVALGGPATIHLMRATGVTAAELLTRGGSTDPQAAGPPSGRPSEEAG
jgi:uncharacterized membrane protein YbhN (UPF0104 family)